MKTTARIIIILVLIALAVALGKNIYSQASKFKEIYQAESKVRKLSKENQELESKLEGEKDTFFLEKQARDKLGYQRWGETLYVIDTKERRAQETREESRENWQKWVDLILN
jgi:cell division protein FtsB